MSPPPKYATVIQHRVFNTTCCTTSIVANYGYKFPISFTRRRLAIRCISPTLGETFTKSYLSSENGEFPGPNLWFSFSFSLFWRHCFYFYPRNDFWDVTGDVHGPCLRVIYTVAFSDGPSTRAVYTGAFFITRLHGPC